MKYFSVIVLILIMSIDMAIYFEIKEISMKMDGFKTEQPNVVRSIIKWLI